MDWVSFWDGANAIYVNERHKRVHYERLAADLARFVPGPTARVLDYGCGEALAAQAMARICAHLTLSDAAPSVREKLKARFSAEPAISVRSIEEVEALPDGSFDLVVVNSLAQYLSRAQLEGLLKLFHRLLAPSGRLLLADVIPPGVGAARDAAALLSFAARDGFFFAAVLGLARTAVSPYRKLRADLGLATYEEADVLALLRTAGFRAERHRPNVGHNQARMAFLATR
ncbi:class I SAM-dependent methyltransferase [Roseixanthobacter pseudopolyaromaticivorans]|uniref:class I SAM-dependent methyltransferase n=1 Tax=Xanthobacteraceae TaxID=335928 RepID=UPI00372C50D5